MLAVRFLGELDAARYPEIAETFRACPDGEIAVVVDLSRVTWIDSLFMSQLILFMRRNEAVGRHVVVVASGNVLHVLVVGGIDKRATIVSDLARAAAAIERLTGLDAQVGTPQERLRETAAES